MKALSSSGYVTPRDYSAYVKFHVLRGKYYRFTSVLIKIFLAALAIGLFVYGFLTGEKNYFIIAGCILLVMGMFVYTVNNTVKRTCNGSAKVIRAKQQTVFGKDGFALDLIFQNAEENEHDEIFYDELEKIYFAKNAIYIYIEKRSVIVIPKRNLTVTPDEAKRFLIKYIDPQKLVICA